MNKFIFGLSQNSKQILLLKNASKISQTFQKFSSSAEIGSKEHLDTLVSKNKVVVFMKGNPEEPKCGFSNAVVQIMRMHDVKYDAHDVLQDERIRQGIKDYSEWPTIPQVFLNGELIGGCDILIQMHQNGELIEQLQKNGITSALLQEANEKGEKDEK
ncbi:UNVERIFIED_CONTAM: hypothetical protein RMT77_017391 [Armadillidium vulgare]|nr:Glutaredoxin-related protein 5, mitochondrial [Armadillidium vulgare]